MSKTDRPHVGISAGDVEPTVGISPGDDVSVPLGAGAGAPHVSIVPANAELERTPAKVSANKNRFMVVSPVFLRFERRCKNFCILENRTTSQVFLQGPGGET